MHYKQARLAGCACFVCGQPQARWFTAFQPWLPLIDRPQKSVEKKYKTALAIYPVMKQSVRVV
ncbi:MAG: hypothetical protein WCO56_28710 [Verrucomicrobiota bacterium]